jgi:hypothetical protein
MVSGDMTLVLSFMKFCPRIQRWQTHGQDIMSILINGQEKRGMRKKI